MPLVGLPLLMLGEEVVLGRETGVDRAQSPGVGSPGGGADDII